MSARPLLSLALVAAISASSVYAQQRRLPRQFIGCPLTAMGCGKSTMKRHDHGAERNTGSTAGAMTMPCKRRMPRRRRTRPPRRSRSTTTPSSTRTSDAAGRRSMAPCPNGRRTMTLHHSSPGGIPRPRGRSPTSRATDGAVHCCCRCSPSWVRWPLPLRRPAPRSGRDRPAVAATTGSRT